MLQGDLTLGLFADVTRGELKGGDNVPRLPPQRVGVRLSWSGDDWKLWSLLVKADDQDKPGANEAASKDYLRWALLNFKLR